MLFKLTIYVKKSLNYLYDQCNERWLYNFITDN